MQCTAKAHESKEMTKDQSISLKSSNDDRDQTSMKHTRYRRVPELTDLTCIGLVISEEFNKVIPISMESSRETYTVDDVIYHRWQLPWVPASAITTHKVQGFTTHDGVVFQAYLNPPSFARGLDVNQL